MKRWIRCLLIPAAVVAMLVLGASQPAQAGRVVVRAYYPYSCYYGVHVYRYRYPRRVYYYTPAPVVVYPAPVFVAPPLLPPPPLPAVGYYYIW